MAEGYKKRLKGAGNPGHTPVEDRFWDKVDKAGECWEWTAYCNRASKEGSRFLPYGRIRDRGKLRLAHRVSWEIEHGSIPDGKLVLHTCDNPKCVRPDHLFLGDHEVNMADKVDKERHHGSHKLTADEVREIRRRYREEDGHTHQSLADEYGVTKSAITHLMNRRSWKHI